MVTHSVVVIAAVVVVVEPGGFFIDKARGLYGLFCGFFYIFGQAFGLVLRIGGGRLNQITWEVSLSGSMTGLFLKRTSNTSNNIIISCLLEEYPLVHLQIFRRSKNLKNWCFLESNLCFLTKDGKTATSVNTSGERRRKTKHRKNETHECIYQHLEGADV